MNQGVCYVGSWLDYSGYGSANRAFITALYVAQLDITTRLEMQVPERSYHGWTGELCKSLQNRNIPYRIKIIHLTPDMYQSHMEEGKYHIGHLFWETDRLPNEWIEPCNKMGEMWTSSASMAEVFKSSGVKVPIYWFPQPLDITESDRPYDKFEIKGHKGLLFYSIFQWIERKNPIGLLRAYWETFQGRDDVTLLLKTYRVTYAKTEYEKIIGEINELKRKLNYPHYPKVLITTKLMTHDEIMRLHTTGDCFVLADRGEGWCRPLAEALLLGKVAITTSRGGIHEYLEKDYYFPVPSECQPVTEVSWIAWYKSYQNWAVVDEQKLKETMMFVFQNYELAKAKGILAKDYMKNTFSYHKIGLDMRKRLEAIDRGL